MTAVCGAAIIVLGLFRIWLTMRGRRVLRVGELADGTEVIVRREGSMRELVLVHGQDELVQSRSDGSGYVREFHRAMRTTPRPQRILFLGGGACVGPTQFARRYADATIDVVEREELVAEAAKRHFDFRETDRLKLHIEDVREFLPKASPYDLIILDIYDAHGIPPSLTTTEFFASVRAVIAPGGTLVANLLRPAEPAILDALRAAFPDAPLDVQDVSEENTLVFAATTNVV
jgi:spermidine synthase